MNDKIHIIAEYVLSGQDIDRHQAETLVAESEKSFYDLLFWSNRIREEFFGDKVRLCSIVPGRLGGCSEDCAFCAQSGGAETEFKRATHLSDEEIFGAAVKAKEAGVPFFGIVNSGKRVSEDELVRVEGLIKKIKGELGLGMCASLGILDVEQAKRLKAAGLDRFNHNLETSERHFKNIVTTHEYADRVNTIKALKEAGLGICGGGIFGIGENWDDRIDMAMELRGLEVDMVPMNFLHPIEGTKLEGTKKLTPKEILTIVAVYRFMLPNAHIKVAGGRVLNLRDMQSWIFMAGCTSIISGDYLTTAGRSVADDVRMIEDMGLTVEKF